MIKRECCLCGKTFKTRRGLYYLKPEVVREKVDENFKGYVTLINKEELGAFICLQCCKKRKIRYLV